MKFLTIGLLFVPLALFAKVNYDNDNIMEEISDSLIISNENLDEINDKLTKLNKLVEKLCDCFTPIIFDYTGEKIEDKKN